MELKRKALENAYPDLMDADLPDPQPQGSILRCEITCAFVYVVLVAVHVGSRPLVGIVLLRCATGAH